MQQFFLTGLEYNQLLADMRALVRDEVAQVTQATYPAGGPDKEQLLTILEAAKLLDVCPQTIHEWKRRGLLVFSKLGNRTYIKRSDLLAALQGQKRSFKPAR
jgi:excisionase family DNA binding protein